MYKKFFGLTVNPFNVNPDPRFLFLTRHTTEALACLGYGIQKRKGFVLLTGGVGTGKTTLLNRMLEHLHKQRVKTAFIFNPRLDTVQFLRMMLTDFGIPCETRDKADHLMLLNQWLLDRYRAGETAVLIVDEAQNLSAELLEEIRLLTNLETSTEKLLQIVLSGQPELEVKLKDPRLRQLWQRITLRCRTYPFTLEETQRYIEQRLRLAGGNGNSIFPSQAVAAIYEYAQGIPRVINLLCEHALINAYAEQKNTVSADTIGVIAHEFELDQITPTVPPQEPAAGENISVIEALRTVVKLGEQLREAERTTAIRQKG